MEKSVKRPKSKVQSPKSRPAAELNFIDGKWVPARSGRTFKDLNPADPSDVVGEFPASNAKDVDAAVDAAKRAFPRWRTYPAPKRAEMIFRLGELMTRRKAEIASEMTREMGKVLKEAEGDTQEGIDCAFHHAGEGRRLFGFTTPSEMREKFAMAMRVPVGVVGLITPWNFPLAIPTWKMFPALVAGNTVVLKPASDVPKTATTLVELMEEIGFPPGVVNLVHGSGGDVGMPLVKHPDARVISFTGSSGVGRDISQIAGAQLKRVSLELGGKNAQIVMDDADLDLAVEGVLFGAFGTTGQRCTATSRLVVHRKIKDAMLSKLVDRARKLKLGDGRDPGVDVGPLINEGARKKVHEYVEIGKKEGASLLCGGEPAPGKGWFYKPTIFDGVTRKMRLAREEIFGPVLSVLTVGTFEEGVETLNDCEYGLSASIYTRDVNRAFKAIDQFESGIVYINAPTIGAESHLPFGGVKNTGNGHREGGHPVYDVFTEWKTVFVDFSGKLQKAQIDNQGMQA